MADARRVVARYLVAMAARSKRASLSGELQAKVEALLAHPTNKAAYGALARWMDENFFFNSSKTPKGQKQLKEHLQWFHRMVESTSQGNLLTPEYLEQQRDELERRWKSVEAQLPNVELFARGGGSSVPQELKLGGNLYLNLVGMGEDALRKYAERLEHVFAELNGWRQRALEGGIKVALAGPKHFRGTVGGKYKAGEDTLYVRATPAILKRSGHTYGSFEYIIVHELGHRYERKNRLPEDFDKIPWWTTRYSRNEGESFAELFAISNFKLTGTWDPGRLDRFESVMGGL